MKNSKKVCTSPEKRDFCEKCERNIDIWDINEQSEIGTFVMFKNTSTKPVTYKCSGYIRGKS